MGKFQDLSGHKFGRLFVVKRTDDYVTAGGKKKTQYLCQCDCGNVVKVHSERLKNGHTMSCGCLSKEMSLQRIVDLNSSGKNIDDLINRRFGRLVVQYMLSRDDSYKNRSRRWHCLCDCGNELNVFGSSLKSGLTQSCGCYNSEVRQKYNDLSGQVFGFWTVVFRGEDYVKPSGQKEPQYLCRCKCGQERLVLAQSLKSGLSYSCGCNRQTIGEAYLADLFNELNISYVSQLKFDDLLSPLGDKLSYDFGIYDDNSLIGLVEYQGQQHYHPVDWFGGIETFERQQKYDEIKKIYALWNLRVPLLEIPYTCHTYESIKSKFVAFYEVIRK